MKGFLWPGLLAATLLGCDAPPSPPATPVQSAVAPQAPEWKALEATSEVWKHVKPGCKGPECAWVEADLQNLSDPALQGLLVRTLVGMVSLGEQPLTSDSWAGLESEFWPKTGPSWNIGLQNRILHQSGPLLTLQLDVYTYSGGAHGIEVTRYLNIDRSRGNAILTLADILLPGKEAAFWGLVRIRHNALRKEMALDEADFANAWPFQTTGNFAITAKGVVLKYQAYDLGPYALGQPEFLITRDQLVAIVRPEFLH